MNFKKELLIFYFILIFCSCNSQENNIVQQKSENESARLNDSAILIFAKNQGDIQLMNKALQLIEKAIQKDSLNANAYVNKANILCNLAKYAEAIKAINQSLSIKNVPEVKLMKG
ncbi:MAG TPA: tetratricopeptide repeat protein, partial [Flavisolibacter sp.]